MTPTEEIPFNEMCDHARRSLIVNGLTPKEWRWGADAVRAFKSHPMHNYMVACDPPLNFPKGCLLVWQDLPVFPMRANGVACVARSSYKGKIAWANP
jgi:hypothetical protein